MGVYYHQDSKIRTTTLASKGVLKPTTTTATNNCNFNVLNNILIIITYTNQIFSDNALGLKRAIERMKPSFANVVATGDFNYYDFKAYLRQYLLCHQLKVQKTNPRTSISHVDNLFENEYYKVIQIAIGAHEPPLLLKNYIVFDVEQIWSTFMKFDTFEMVLHSAIGVFTMSKQHSIKLQALKGMDKSKFYDIPLYTTTLENYYIKNSEYDLFYNDFIHDYSTNSNDSLNKKIQETNANIVDVALQNVPKVIDVLFFGSCSTHRMEFIEFFKYYHIMKTARGQRKRLNIVFKCLTKWTDALLDEQRDYYVKIARIVVNIHASLESSLEIHRITYLLSLGKCVISERSSFDEKLDRDYEDTVVFGDDFEDVSEKIFYYLDNYDELFACEEQAKRTYKVLDTNIDSLNLALRKIASEL